MALANLNIMFLLYYSIFMRMQYDMQIYIYIILPQGPWILAGSAYLKNFDAQPTLMTTYPQVFYTIKMDDLIQFNQNCDHHKSLNFNRAHF